MFESDDFDQVLSQFDFPDVTTKTIENPKDVSAEINPSPNKQRNPVKLINKNSLPPPHKILVKEVETTQICNTADKHTLSSTDSLKFINTLPPPQKVQEEKNETVQSCTTAENNNIPSMNSKKLSPTTKRKMINSYFDQNAKRKFPGPAGLLRGNFEEWKDDPICHMELCSQDIDMLDFRGDKFESQIWKKLLDDVRNWNLGALDSIKSVKQQALAGNLRGMKAQAVVACVETVDRSAGDPLVTLRDTTGYIKCALHRDAWSTFSPYFVSEFCALVLRRPTVLTLGSRGRAFKNHYLIITLNNIHAIYSSAVLTEKPDSKPLPENYHINCDNNITIITFVSSLQNLDKDPSCNETANDTSDLLDDLDNIFNDDLF